MLISKTCLKTSLDEHSRCNEAFFVTYFCKKLLKLPKTHFFNKKLPSFVLMCWTSSFCWSN